MQITELVWKLFLMLLPGVVSTLMLRQISSSRKDGIFEFIIQSALFGIATFLLMEFGYSLFNIIKAVLLKNHKLEFGLNLSIWENIFDNSSKYNKVEILISYILSIPLGVFYGFLLNKKLINKLFQKLRITKRYGDNDVWSFFLNSPTTQWILVRDKSTNLTYFGKIRAYSDSAEKREILLNDVKVYTSNTWQHLYDSETVFLELDNYNFSIEIPT
jgi:hypothetical protein